MIRSKPLVSAIVSTYNSEKFFRGKIEDLLSQTIADKLEIIVINSGSQENEDSIIQDYLKKYDCIKYIHTEERETIYKAWNRGIKIATGKYITNANADDRLHKNAFQMLAKYLDENPQIALVYADQILTSVENQKYEEVNKNRIIHFPDYSHLKQLERCIIGSQPMWRASLHTIDNIWFDDKYEVCGDHEFELKVSEKYGIHHLSIPIGTFYKSPSRSNKEYENPDRTRSEVTELTTGYLQRYLEGCSKSELSNMQKKYKINIQLPILFYELTKRIERIIFRGIYSRYFFHSIEFIYFMNIVLYEKMGDVRKSIKLCKKFLRYKKSDRICQKYLQYKAEVR